VTSSPRSRAQILSAGARPRGFGSPVAPRFPLAAILRYVRLVAIVAVSLGLIAGVLDYFLPLPFHDTVKTQVDEWKQAIDHRVFGAITSSDVGPGAFEWSARNASG